MKSIHLPMHKTAIYALAVLLSMTLFLGSCAIEKHHDKILKNSTKDTLTKLNNYGTIKTLGRIKKRERGEILFDQYIANDFKLPTKKKDSAAIVNYFVKTSFAQLGRREFRQWDIVIIRGVAFQINVRKIPYPERSLLPDQTRIEVIGLILFALGFYFF